MRRCLSLTFLLAGILLTPLSAQAQTITGQGFNPILWGPSSAAEGIVQYTLDANGIPGQRYVNVVSDTGSWIVQNLPVGFGGSTDSVATNVDQSLLVGGLYDTVFTAAPLTAAPTFTVGSPLVLGADVNYLANDASGKAGFGVFTTTGGPTGNLAGGAFGGLVGADYHIGVPDLAQGANECAPTSAANSLTWLNNRLGLGLGLTTAQIRDILKDAAHMNTSAATGTTDPNFIVGKNRFVAENSLPINTHVIGGGAALGGRAPGLGVAPSTSGILKELQNGQDVELSVIWAAGGGHWVTLVGAVDLGGAFGVWYNDPDDGQNRTRFSWLDSVGGGLLRVRGFGAANTVDLTIAESQAPEPATLSLLIVGVVGLTVTMKRRRAIAA